MTATTFPDSPALKTMSAPDLVKVYNAHRGDAKPVKRFASKAVALRRVEALRSKAAPKKEKKRGGRSVVLINFPARAKQRPLLAPEKTNRGRLVKMLSTGPGLTVEEVRKAFGNKWSTAHTRFTLRQIHRMAGYGVKEDPETGKVKVFTA